MTNIFLYRNAYLQFILLCTTLLLTCLTCYAQSSHSSQSLLQQGIRANEALTAERATDMEVDLPDKQLIDQMEFRTEFNELDLTEQEYTFRMRFRNDKLRKEQNQLFKMQLSYLESRNNANQNDGAENIYVNIVKWHFLQQKERIYQQKSGLAKDKNNLEMALLQDDQTLNFNDILKIRARAKDIELDKYALSNQKKELMTNLFLTDTNAILSNENWIELATLQNVIKDLDSRLEDHPDLGLYADRVSLLNQEYVVEQNDIDNILDFAQLRYKADNNVAFERELSLGLGILIPYKRVNQANLTEIEIEKIEEKLKQKNMLSTLQKELIEERNELSLVIEKYVFLTQFVKEENLDLLKKEYLASDHVSPLPLLNLELMLLARQLELIEAEEDIYLQYINTLENIALLRLANNTNYLDENLAPIE